jgi:hypothetical protein
VVDTIPHEFERVIESRYPMNEIIKVIRVASCGGHRLRIAFSNGSEGGRDLADVIAEGGIMVEPLADERFFFRVFIEKGTLAWPNGSISIRSRCMTEMEAAGLLHRRAA